MKKRIIYVTSIILFLGIGIVGCKKELSTKVSEENEKSFRMKKTTSNLYSVHNNMLVINSVEDFDDLIDLANEKLYQQLIDLDYVAYQETVIDDSLNVIDDAFLSAVLNKDFVVQIGNYIYRINKPSEKVYALHKDHYDNYSDLISENIGNSKIFQFSTEDDVFDMLSERKEKNKDDGDEKAISRKCCNTQYDARGFETYANFTDTKNIYGKGTNKKYKFKVKLEAGYNNWGIYRKLYTCFKHRKTKGNTWHGTDVSISFFYFYKSKKNKKMGNQSHYATCPSPTTTYAGGYEYFHDNKEIPHYRGTRCLASYSIKSKACFRNRETLKSEQFPWGSDMVSVSCN